jgi:hypothetical protein
MSDLIERLRITAGMIAMCEKISWGEDSAVMQEAAAALEAKDAKIEKLKNALEAAQAWIVDGGYLDDRDPYTADSAAAIYAQTSAALSQGENNE